MIKLTRDSGYADRLRAYKVVVDGETIGTIKNGETKEFDVPAGSRQLVIKIDWCGSNTVSFEVDGRTTAEFSCGSNLRGIKVFAALFYILFRRNGYLWLRQN